MTLKETARLFEARKQATSDAERAEAQRRIDELAPVVSARIEYSWEAKIEC